MKRTATIVFLFLSGSALAASPPAFEAVCKATVLASVKVPDSDLTLTDVLAPGTCAPLLQAASRVQLGKAPLPGSPRILDGAGVRRFLEPLAAAISGRKVEFQIPERIVIERVNDSPARAGNSVLHALSSSRFPSRSPEGTTQYVKRGETAILIWEHGGIRVMLPVICLEAGGPGETVRARIKNGDRILHAEVVGPGSLHLNGGA